MVLEKKRRKASWISSTAPCVISNHCISRKIRDHCIVRMIKPCVLRVDSGNTLKKCCIDRWAVKDTQQSLVGRVVQGIVFIL